MKIFQRTVLKFLEQFLKINFLGHDGILRTSQISHSEALG